MTPSSADIVSATRQATALSARNDQAMQTFMGWLTARAETTDEDQYAIMASVIGEIMSSGNVAELLAERSPLKARELIGAPLILHGFEIREGDYEESIVGFYAALTVSRPGSDETRIVTCGGTKVMAKLMMLDHLINQEGSEDEWPLLIMFTEKKTSKNYGVLDIVRPQVTQ